MINSLDNYSKRRIRRVYLIGLGGNRNAGTFFFDTERKYQPSPDEFYTGMLIKSYSVSEYNSYETHVLLGSWIAEALEIEFEHCYPYKQEKLDLIYSKPNYEDVKKSVIEEIKRIYKETQLFLNDHYPDSKEITLIRTLNNKQHNQYINGEEITYNFITSYCPSLKHTYPGERAIINNSIDKKKILAFTNLSKNGQSLGDLENEVIVIHSNQL